MSCEEFAHARLSESEIVRKAMKLGDVGEPGFSPAGFDNSQRILAIAIELRELVLSGERPQATHLEVDVNEQRV